MSPSVPADPHHRGTLPNERDRIENEIGRLERKILERRDSVRFAEDLEMVESLKRILVALRNEHRVIVETLDHAISVIESPERVGFALPHPPSQATPKGGSPRTPTGQITSSVGGGGETFGLESLVRKVQNAVGEPRDPRKSLNTTPCSHGRPDFEGESAENETLEMSVSTINYLYKYDLLERQPVPRSPLTPTVNQQYRRPTHMSEGLAFQSRTAKTPGATDTRILDEDLIRRMPKL